jgi:hypothetical protein
MACLFSFLFQSPHFHPLAFHRLKSNICAKSSFSFGILSNPILRLNNITACKSAVRRLFPDTHFQTLCCRAVTAEYLPSC